MCLVLDPPRTTVEGQQAPVTGHMAWRILRPRVPYMPLPTLAEGDEVAPTSCEVSSPSGDYFDGCGYPLAEDQPQVPGDLLKISCKDSLELGIPPENGDLLSHTKNSVSYFASACDLSCEKKGIKSINVVVEPPHLLSLWDRHRSGGFSGAIDA